MQAADFADNADRICVYPRESAAYLSFCRKIAVGISEMITGIDENLCGFARILCGICVFTSEIPQILNDTGESTHRIFRIPDAIYDNPIG